uniref:Uncharacterized protein AlNc14C24G2397 n=1 Tax=Albugo laibachii Nc14 TaxID=890382 RepID=F0W697_9STRA|nr:conserved hypothetical protein [Albugo laibachii Nc14]|eukprot:CCA16640.1 conserved hypothetical protein [Albugo laibachii Nc14]
MSRQGYLILHDQHTGAFVYYFSLEDGYLRYYESAQYKVPRGELLLSGSKINVKAQKRQDGTPNSFFVETRKVFVRERTYTLGNPIRLELSACTNDDRQDWGRALFSWQRYYWREPDQIDELHGLADDEKTRRFLVGIVEHLNPKSTQPYFSRALSARSQSFGQLAAHQPRRRFSITKKPFARPLASSYNSAASIALQPFKFIQKNALALQKTISMSYTTSPSSKASTASSSSPTSDNQDTTSKPYGGSIDKTDNHAHNNMYQEEIRAASTRPIGTCC